MPTVGTLAYTAVFYANGLTTAGTRDVATLALRNLREGDRGGDRDREVVKAEAVDQLIGVRVDLKRRNRRVEGRDLGHVLVLECKYNDGE